MTRVSMIFSMLIVMAVSGCGYTSGSLLPPEIKTIHVSNFENKVDTAQTVSDRRSTYSYRPNLESDIRREVINRFMFDGNLQITDVENADLVLEGALKDFEQTPLSYDDNDNVEELRIRIIVELTLYDNRTGEVMWTENSFMGREDYDLVGSRIVSEDFAAQKAVEDLSKRIVERTVEAW